MSDADHLVREAPITVDRPTDPAAGPTVTTAVLLVSRLRGGADPMLPVLGRPMIAHVLDRLAEAGIAQVQVLVDPEDTGDLALDDLKALLAADRRMAIDILDLGPGQPLAAAVESAALQPDRPVLLTTSDTLWLDGPVPAIERMRREWGRAAPDALFLMVATVRAHAPDRRGDARIAPDGALVPPVPGYVPPYFFARVALVRPDRLDAAAARARTFEALAQPWIGVGRGWAVVHDGLWFCLAHGEGREEAQAMLGEGRIRWVLQ